MMSAEIYKLRTQRKPILYAAAVLVGVLIPSVVFVWYVPTDPSSYAEAFAGTFGLVSILFGVEFGGWLLGAEYRQGTVKRLLASEPRRLRALTTKGLVGAGALTAVLTVGAVVGWTATRFVASLNEVDVAWEGRALLADVVTALAAATVAYSLSAVTRSDSFAKVGTIALILLLDPLLTSIPNVGKYAVGSALERVTAAVAGDSETIPTIPTGAAGIALAVWLGAFVAAGAALFVRRDV